MEYLYILFVGELIILFLTFFNKNIDLLNPSMAFNIVFVISTFLACAYANNWNEIKNFNKLALFFIITGIIVISIIDYSVYISTKHKDKIYSNCGREILLAGNIQMIILIAIDFAILCVFYNYMIWVVDKYNALERYNVSAYSAAYRLLYGHDAVVSQENQMGSFLRYSIYFLQSSAYVCLYPFINNIFIQKKAIKSNIVYIIPALIFLFYGIICGSRGDVIKMTVSGFFIFYFLRLKINGWNWNNIKKFIYYGIKTVIFVLVVFFLLSIAVGRSAVSESLIKSLLAQIAGYAGAPILHFSQYIESPTQTLTMGEESFNNLFLFLNNHGFPELNSIKHLEYRRLVGGSYGNIYTFFRRPLHDFGIIGMYVFIFLFAIFLTVFYYRFLKYTNYKNKDLFGVLLIIYSILFQWIAYSSIDQISGEFISINFLIRVFFIVVVYIFLFCLDIKSKKIIFL